MGKNGEQFDILKLQTMDEKRDADGVLLPDEQRVTKLGKLLRHTGIDELPQIFNILKGDMSVVGPRPHYIDDFPSLKKKSASGYVPALPDRGRSAPSARITKILRNALPLSGTMRRHLHHLCVISNLSRRQYRVSSGAMASTS